MVEKEYFDFAKCVGFVAVVAHSALEIEQNSAIKKESEISNWLGLPKKIAIFFYILTHSAAVVVDDDDDVVPTCAEFVAAESTD